MRQIQDLISLESDLPTNPATEIAACKPHVLMQHLTVVFCAAETIRYKHTHHLAWTQDEEMESRRHSTIWSCNAARRKARKSKDY